MKGQNLLLNSTYSGIYYWHEFDGDLVASVYCDHLQKEILHHLLVDEAAEETQDDGEEGHELPL